MSRRRLKHTEDRVRALLLQNGPMTASNIGAHLWGKGHTKPQSFARPAGKLLRLLERQGLVRVNFRDGHDFWEAVRK